MSLQFRSSSYSFPQKYDALEKIQKKVLLQNLTNHDLKNLYFVLHNLREMFEMGASFRNFMA